ncbi:hypothetical protein DL96DRAFT_876257 [Flagelloscypha sp. PMI_526]|nr:hypothetical protein DL96DRAFT_876257 [Flagelloscypha sp. PMI_526]
MKSSGFCHGRRRKESTSSPVSLPNHHWQWVISHSSTGIVPHSEPPPFFVSSNVIVMRPHFNSGEIACNQRLPTQDSPHEPKDIRNPKSSLLPSLWPPRLFLGGVKMYELRDLAHVILRTARKDSSKSSACGFQLIGNSLTGRNLSFLSFPFTMPNLLLTLFLLLQLVATCCTAAANLHS